MILQDLSVPIDFRAPGSLNWLSLTKSINVQTLAQPLNKISQGKNCIVVAGKIMTVQGWAKEKAPSSEIWARTFRKWLIGLCIGRPLCLATLGRGAFQTGDLSFAQPCSWSYLMRAIFSCQKLRKVAQYSWLTRNEEYERYLRHPSGGAAEVNITAEAK